MLLDKHRLKIWLKENKLPEDVLDTIEFYIELEDCTIEYDQLKNQVEMLKNQIENLKKPVSQPEKVIKAKFDSTCKLCGGVTKTGTDVFWTPGISGVKHVQCPGGKETKL